MHRVWELDSIEAVGGYPIDVDGRPVVVDGPYGSAIQFNGAGDALFVESNPLAGLEAFTVEMVFRPDAGGLPEQRFFHLGEVNGDRVLFETRLTEDGHWYLDTFVSSGDSNRPLLNESHLHPVGQWYHLALTCDGQQEVNYVNGIQEASGSIDFVPLLGGQTSIGVRLNRVCWFRGAIGRIRFSAGVLDPDEFMG
ncbi:MAG: LamG-like jellyroll fold domain-containing protein [Candidatus Latescibacterota bacterium]